MCLFLFGLFIIEGHKLNTYRASQKKLTFCICLRSQEPRNGFLNSFFLLKTDTHIKILSTKPFLCDIMGLIYLQIKMGF